VGAGVPFAEAIEFLRRRLDLPAGEWRRLVAEVDAAARDRSAGMSDALVEDILRAVLASLEGGGSQAEFLAAFDELVARHGWTGDNTEGWRAALTFRVLTAQAMAAGRWRQIERLKLPWIRYVTAGDHRVRPEHAAWHNLVLAADDPWWDTHFPPNGFNCRCHVQGLDADDLKRYRLTPGEAPASGTVIRYVRINGVLTPVETPKGIDPGFAFNPGKIGLVPPPGTGGGAGGPSAPSGLFDGLPRQWPPAPRDEREALALAERLAAGQADWEETLGEIERDAIADYKGAGFLAANQLLRGETGELDGDDIASARMLVKTLAAALARARLPVAVTTFRGVPSDVATELLSFKIGERFFDPAFVSASLLETVAARFGEFLIEARYPAGTPAIALIHFIPDVTNDEIEMLLAPGAWFQVIERRPGRIVVEVIP
jgi:SPP1 gp7 family putative phage head morphogenesis protein